MIGSLGYGRTNDGVIHPRIYYYNGSGHLLIRFWEADRKTTHQGTSCYDLTTHPGSTFHTIRGDDGNFLHYMTHSAGCIISVNEDKLNDEKKFKGGTPEGVISRVYRTGRPEMSPNISFYLKHQYPDKDFALSCGILASFCFPYFILCHDQSGPPDGVMEIVSSSDQDLVIVRRICDAFQDMGLCRLSGFPKINVREYAIPEMDHFLEAVCQTFKLPLAQYWITAYPFSEILSVVHQFSYKDIENLEPWCKFKDICLEKTLNIGEGLVGSSYTSHDSFFCGDITQLSITDYPFAHYARNCGSIACFIISLCCSFQQDRRCVLEFFFPSQEMDAQYPQTLLNSLLATMDEHLQYYTVAAGEHTRRVLSVKVVNSSTQSESESLNVGQPYGSPPHHEGSESNILLELFKDSAKQDEYVSDIQRSNSNSYEKSATGESSKRTPNKVTEIICLDELEEPRSKYIEHCFLASRPERHEKKLEYEGTMPEIDHSALGMALKEASKLKTHTVSAERVDELHDKSSMKCIGSQPLTSQPRRSEVNEPVEVSTIEESYYATRNECLGYATSNVDMRYDMTTASQPSESQPMESICQQKESMILENERETSQQLPRILQQIFEDGTKQDEQVPVIKKDAPTTCEEISTGTTSKRTPGDVEQIIYLDELEAKSPIECIASQSVTSQQRSSEETLGDEGYTVVSERENLVEMSPDEDIERTVTTALKRLKKSKIPSTVENTLDELEEKSLIKCIEPQSISSRLRSSKEIFGDEGNSVMIDHSTTEITLEELVKQGEHNVAVKRVNEQVEKSPMDHADVGYAMTIESQPFYSGTMISTPQQEFQKEINVSENLAETCILWEDDTNIHSENKTSIVANTSKSERKIEESISFESLSEHFGRPLDEAAMSFGVSRSTFKRICRDFGIKRWQHKKRRMDYDISSKIMGRQKNEEPSKRNISYATITPMHDTVVAPTCQDLNKMTVKVTYNGINIRFKLPSSSGIEELENNVTERLHLETKSFSIKYQDDEGDWIFIACDKDVWECMEIARSLKKTTIKLLLDLPIHQYAN